MFFIISKILAFLIQPLVWVMILLVLAWRCNAKKRKKFLIAAVLTLYFFSNQAIFFEVSHAYEADAKKADQLKEHYEAAIILGGMVSLDEENGLVAFAESSDRFLAVLPLYFDSTVDKLIISGGSGSLLQEEKESEILKNYLVKIGVTAEDILIDTQSRNTHQNALYTAELIKEHNLEGPFLLSTSAAHIYRAELCFKKQGLNFDIYPVDHIAIERKINFSTLFIPQSEVLVKWKYLLHEWLGLLSYKMRGYI